MNQKSIILIGAVVTAAFLIAYFSLTLFVIQPIGALPEGRTLVISRLSKTQFIDSADAMCEREMGGVSLLCRSMMIGNVLKSATTILRLPYSETLYFWSTGGRDYGR